MKISKAGFWSPVALSMAGVLFPLAVAAAGFDGKSNLACAATDVVACVSTPGCVEGRAGAFEVPEFMYVDFKGKRVHARFADAKSSVDSPFRNLVASDLSLVIQGMENHQGWTLSVDRASGRMTTTVSGGKVSYMIFGVCTPL